MINKIYLNYQNNFVQWYTDVVLAAELADYTSVKGLIVLRPYGFSLWEMIQNYLKKAFKELKIKEAYFPSLIPLTLFNKEKEHIEGFSPEIAVINQLGDKKLVDPLVLRPTSETIINPLMAKWIHSQKDLPLLLNQWCSVFRAEKNTRPFLRTSEFLWQEGHTAHATSNEAQEFCLNIAYVYKKIMQEILALPVLMGEKPAHEKFAGAQKTIGLETLTHDGKSLQIGTSHYLGDNFAQVYNLRYLNSHNNFNYCFTTSWGVSTRLIGALIMVHGDSKGLVLPPLIAPLQAVIILVKPSQQLQDYALIIEKILNTANIRVKIDENENYSFGWKINQYEIQGIPLRIILGKNELATQTITVIRRDLNEKTTLQFNEQTLAPLLKQMLDAMQQSLIDKANYFLTQHMSSAQDFLELKTKIEQQFIVEAFWCGNDLCTNKLKTELQASIRLLCDNNAKEKDKCVVCGEYTFTKCFIARSY